MHETKDEGRKRSKARKTCSKKDWKTCKGEITALWQMRKMEGRTKAYARNERTRADKFLSFFEVEIFLQFLSDLGGDVLHRINQPSKWKDVELQEDKYRVLYDLATSHDLDSIAEYLYELAPTQSELLKGYKLDSVCIVAELEHFIRIYMKKTTGTVTDRIGLDIYLEESDEDWE